LKDEGADVRCGAAEALGKLGDARAVEPLIACLEELDWAVRNSAAIALGNLRDARAVEPLIACLKAQDARVRASAAIALGNLGDARAAEPLIACLKDKDAGGRSSAAIALGNLGDARAVSELVDALPDWDAKAQLGVALKTLGWNPTTDSEQVYFWICNADRANLNTQWGKTKRVLLADLQSGDQRKIKNAIYTFVSLGKEEIIPMLIHILNTQGGKEMAETYLNCGDGRLADAARSSASAHGYQISTAGAANKPGWGSW
jgi:hypothetical protein